MTGTIPKNAGSTSKIGSQKARALCGNPRRSFHFFRAQRIPCGQPWLSGVFSRIHETFPGSHGNPKKSEGPGWTGCPFPRKAVFRTALRNPRSWRVLAGANRRDWFVRISNRFCRSFHLSRNGGIASKITARDPFRSDGYLF